jgi:hypothetical protein
MTVKDYNSLQPVYVASTVVNSDDNKRLDNEEQEIAYTPWEANAPPAEAIPAPHVSSTTSTNIPHVHAEPIKSSQGEMANSTSASSGRQDPSVLHGPMGPVNTSFLINKKNTLFLDS